MKRAILTGFEPFGPYKYNPTQESVGKYNGRMLKGIEITSLVLPNAYHGAFDILSEEIDKLSPNMILSTGLSSSIKRIRIEAIGRNIMNGKYPDINGLKPINELIIQDGKPWYQTTADSVGLANALYLAGIAAELSVDAEGFSCNSLTYLTSRRIREEGLPIQNAFFHTPWTDDYLDRIVLEEGKITIRRQDLEKAIEICLAEMGK